MTAQRVEWFTWSHWGPKINSSHVIDQCLLNLIISLHFGEVLDFNEVKRRRRIAGTQRAELTIRSRSSRGPRCHGWSLLGRWEKLISTLRLTEMELWGLRSASFWRVGWKFLKRSTLCWLAIQLPSPTADTRHQTRGWKSKFVFSH